MEKNQISLLMIIFTSFFLMVGWNVWPASEPTQTPTETATLTPIPPTATATVTPTATLTPTPTVTVTPTLGIGSTQVSPKDGMVLVYVPEGEFLMGSKPDDPNVRPDEKPQHKVYLDAFWVYQTEVTNAMYTQCVADGECEPPKRTSSYTRTSYYDDNQYADYPVIYVD